jgi:tRNA-uridine 2-sulfurtransferase
MTISEQQTRDEPRLRVAVAMSGGVDSSVAAALMTAQGHSVVGVTLKLHDCEEARTTRSCCGTDSIVRARTVAGQLNIPHYVVDCVQFFETNILRYAFSEYATGRTPSPCLRCNEQIKFGFLLDWARRIGITHIVTGHYARQTRSSSGHPLLLRGQDPNKDQSYFLSGLTREQLSAVRFPLGDMEKEQVREIAAGLGLSSAATRDSQDACLVSPDESFAQMLWKRFHGTDIPGDFVDESGRVLGTHPGIHHFTIGQRRGLQFPATTRHWVKSIDAVHRRVMVTDEERHLFRDRLTAVELNWIGPHPLTTPRRCEVQVRSRHEAQSAIVSPGGNREVNVIFDTPVRSITPGQAAVLYDGDTVLGRGWIHVD